MAAGLSERTSRSGGSRDGIGDGTCTMSGLPALLQMVARRSDGRSGGSRDEISAPSDLSAFRRIPARWGASR